MIKYRVFVQDVGINGFSGVEDVTARDPVSAILPYCTDKTNLFWYGKKLIALPHDRKDLWPDGKTGVVPEEALSYR